MGSEHVRNALLLYDEARAQADEPWFAWGARRAGLTLARHLLAHASASGRWPTRHTKEGVRDDAPVDLPGERRVDAVPAAAWWRPPTPSTSGPISPERSPS
jgi:hypothetical protein